MQFIFRESCVKNNPKYVRLTWQLCKNTTCLVFACLHKRAMNSDGYVYQFLIV